MLSDWYRRGSLTFGSVIFTLFPNTRFLIGLWLTVVLGVILFLEWIGAANSHYRRIVWTVCLSLAVMPLMGLAVFPSNYVVLIPSLILIIMLVWERWTRQRTLFVLLILVSALLVPFWLHFYVLNGAPEIYLELLRFLPPVATIAGLYWMRWWAFRTPRTWSDQLGGRG